MTTVLSACRDLCMRVGLPAPTAVMNGQNEMTLQILGMLVEAARDLMTRNKAGWQALEHDAEFDTVAGEEQGLLNTIAPGFKGIVPKTFINRTAGHIMVPINAEQAAAQLLIPGPLHPNGYRIARGRFIIPGNTAVGHDMRFTYKTDLWCTDAAGDEYSNLPARDDDIVLLDDECLILGMKWRWKKEKGLAYGEDVTDYDREVQRAIGEDGGEKGEVSLNTRNARSGVPSLGNLVIPG
jgi:hypothetical protein